MKFISSRQGALLKTTLPWVFAVVLLGFLFRQYPLAQLIETSRHLDLFFFVFYAVLYFTVMLAADCVCLTHIFARFGHALPFSKILTLRLASYLPMVLNYGAGQGALAYLVSRQSDVPFIRASGLILLITCIDLYITISFALVGSFFFDPSIAGISLAPLARTLWLGATAGMVLLGVIRKFNLFKRAPSAPKIAELLQLLHMGRLSDFIRIGLMRVPMHLVIYSALYFIAWTFQAHLPLTACLAYTPFVTLFAILPITPGGLGTAQAATVEIFKNLLQAPFLESSAVTASEVLFSMSLAFAVSNYLFKSLTGLLFFKGFLVARSSCPEESAG